MWEVGRERAGEDTMTEKQKDTAICMFTQYSYAARLAHDEENPLHVYKQFVLSQFMRHRYL